MKEQILELLAQGKTYREISQLLGITKATISYHKNGLGANLLKRIDWQAAQKEFDKTLKVKATCKKLNITLSSWFKAVKRGDIVYPDNYTKKQFSIDELIKKNNTARTHLKARLIEEGVLDSSKCGICGKPPFWNGKPLALQLDHINGKGKDNRIENLRLICPNCHSQTETFSGRNAK